MQSNFGVEQMRIHKPSVCLLTIFKMYEFEFWRVSRIEKKFGNFISWHILYFDEKYYFYVNNNVSFFFQQNFIHRNFLTSQFLQNLQFYTLHGIFKSSIILILTFILHLRFYTRDIFESIAIIIPTFLRFLRLRKNLHIRT